MRTRSGLWPVVFLLLMLPACKEDRQRGLGEAAPEIAEYQKDLERLDEVVTALNVKHPADGEPQRLSEDTIPLPPSPT